MKKFVYFIIVASACLFTLSSLQALEPTSYSKSMILESWPELHKAIANEDFNKAESILYSDPTQVQKRAYNSSLDFMELHMLSFSIYNSFKNLYSNREYNYQSYTALELALIYDAPLHFINSLIASGADVNAQRATVVSTGWPFDGLLYTNGYLTEVRTPLFTALDKQNFDAVQLLVDAGADTDKVLWEGLVGRWIGDFGDEHYHYLILGWKDLTKVKETLDK